MQESRKRTRLRSGLAALLLSVALGAACGDAGSEVPETCGDGVLDAGETCDDGDDDPANGCDLTCVPVPREVWHHDWTDLDSQFFVQAVAVAGDGHVFLAGDGGGGAIVVALGLDGAELWRTVVASESVHALAADASGACYLQGSRLTKLDATGELVWSTPLAGRGGGLVLDGEAIHVLYGGVPDGPLRLLRHAAQDGSLQKDVPIGDPVAHPWATDLTLVGASLAVLGSNTPGDFFVVVDAATGTPGPQRSLPGTYHALRGYTNDLLALRARGDGDGAPAALQRIGLDGTIQWTHDFPDAEVDITGLAIGPEGSIVASGSVPWGEHRSVAIGVDLAGQTLWTIEHRPGAPTQDTQVTAPAFGPGFLAVAGLDFTNTMENFSLDRMWVRRYGG